VREMAARQAAEETKRGGGERGSVERGESKALDDSIGDLIVAGAAIVASSGSTKVMEVASDLSES
jgi:hypothetical protein